MTATVSDLATFKRSRKPNNYLVAPEGYCQVSETDAVAPVFGKTSASLFQAVMLLAQSHSNWTVKESDAAKEKIHIVATTRIMRFRDDVFIEILPAGAGDSSLAIYSRSRIGHSDLGKNKSRVTDFLEALKET